MLGLTPAEMRVMRRLRTPTQIQDYLDRVPINFEKRGDTAMSPRRVLRERKALCFEGALFAAAALWVHGEPPLLLDLRDSDCREDHVVTLYRRAGRWGAISKTNHSTLRFRDPIYRSVRELAASYFHEFFMNDNGKKTLVDYSAPFDLRKRGEAWVTAEEDLFDLADALDSSRHYRLYPAKAARTFRRADRMEMRAARIVEWKKSDPRT